MHKLMQYICDELDELERKADKEGKLSMAEIEYADKLAHIKKSLLTAEAMWEDSEYSEDGEGGQPSRRGSYRMSNRNSYRRSSYARGRGATARRDTMGRYSTAEAEDLVEELRDLMQDAPDQQTKQDIQKIVRRLEQM